WTQTMKPDLDARAEAAEQAKRLAAIRAAKAKCRERFAQQPEAEVPGPQSTETTDLAMDLGDPPFLPCPFR
ncbi:hypothetical protein K3N28_21575, partial [Glycomyces sp. TRM65418]|uniref:hypothetical protein n=1 Tax=Glycomyces sp. TRM65418 TaxID=2867006 RepID=UPI001D16801F